MVFGLGNPGTRYAGTRHNVGFMVVDALAERLGVSFRKKLFHSYFIGKGEYAGQSIRLVKPLTFMNASGRVVREVMRETESGISDILVVCDNLDLSLGNCRFRTDGSSGGQKGLESIIRALGTESFMRLTVGIGRPAHKGQVIGHVLSEPRSDESALLSRSVARAMEAVLLLLAEGPLKVMNSINKKEPPS